MTILGTDNAFLYTLLSFSVAGTPYALVNDTETLASNGVDYQPAAFKAALLPQPERGLQTTNLQFSNIAAEGSPAELGEYVSAALDALLGEMVVIRRVFRADPDNVIIEMPLEILSISVTPQSVNISAGFYNLYEQTLPRLFYDERTAPGLA